MKQFESLKSSTNIFDVSLSTISKSCLDNPLDMPKVAGSNPA